MAGDEGEGHESAQHEALTMREIYQAHGGELHGKTEGNQTVR